MIGGKLSYYWVFSVFLPIGTGESAYSDEVLQIGLDFVMVVCSNSGIGLRMHHDGGTGQEVPLAAHLTVFLRVVEL